MSNKSLDGSGIASATYDIVGFPPLTMASQIDGNGKPSSVPQVSLTDQKK